MQRQDSHLQKLNNASGEASNAIVFQLLMRQPAIICFIDNAIVLCLVIKICRKNIGSYVFTQNTNKMFHELNSTRMRIIRKRKQKNVDP